jgi:hypothetical protein
MIHRHVIQTFWPPSLPNEPYLDGAAIGIYVELAHPYWLRGFVISFWPLDSRCWKERQRGLFEREERERGRGLGGARSAIAGLPGCIPVLRAMAASLLQSSSLVAARRTGLDLYGVQFGPHLELERVSSSSCCRRSPLQAGSASSSPPPASLHGECTKSVLFFRRQAS